MKISKFNVNRSKLNVSFKSVSYVSDGLMTSDDYDKLHSIENMSGKNIEQINITGPDMSEINPKISETKEKLSEQNDKLTRLYYLTESQGYCGRVWDESSSSPTAKTYCGNLSMLQQLPELLGLGGYLVQNDHTRRKLSSENHYFFEDGSEAKLDGSMGHYQWGWNRPFYITTWNENNLFFECVSFEPIKGRESYYVPVGSMSASGFAAIDRETDTLVSYCNNSPRYRGGQNNAKWDNDSDKTLLCRPVTFLNCNQYMSAARKNGDGWYSATMRMNAVVQVLFHIIMGTRNSQADFNPVKNSDGIYSCGLGVGLAKSFDNWTNWNLFNNNNPFLSMSECVELGDYTGVSDIRELTYIVNGTKFTKPYTIPIFFGLKNIYGYLWLLSEDEFGENINNRIVHYIRKSMYSEDYVFGTINESVIKGSIGPQEEYNVKEMSYTNLEMWPIVCDKDTSNSTYYCNNYNHINRSVSNTRDIYRNGAAHRGYECGISILSLIQEIRSFNPRFGTCLCEFTEDFLLEPITT